MVIQEYYCLNCKEGFSKDVASPEEKVECYTCHSKEFVRNVTKREKKTINQKYQALMKRYGEKWLELEKRKFQLVFEHNIVAALKKHVPSKEAFNEALSLAKMQTIKQKRDIYKKLQKEGVVEEHARGFKFSGVKDDDV